MKHMADMLLNRDACQEIVMGNTALVRAMIEAGTRVVTSYPGSPTPEIAIAIRSIPPEKRPFYFEFSTNEKVATEVACGAAVNGHLSTVFFKSVGLNVAADTFVQLGLMNLIGGMVIVLGDDPGANSSQNEQDNRHFAQLAYTPLLEPASPREVYLYYKAAAKLSQDLQMPVLLRLTTHVCHAKAKVAFAPFKPRQGDDTPRFSPANGPYVPIADNVFPMKRRALAKLARVSRWADGCDLNRVVDHGNRQRGIITAGLPFLSLMDVLTACATPPDILKLAVVHPLPRATVLKFLQDHQEIKILEELDDILEKEIKSLAFDHRLTCRIFGKQDPEQWVGEYTPDAVHGAIRTAWPDLLPQKISNATPPLAIAWRPAQMCPGCGHRSAFHAVKAALGPEDISVADIGCHTLGFLPPYEVGQLLMCMGASTAIGSGLALFNTQRKVVVFLGDSTFFHAGLPGIINAQFNHHPVTLILMENGTTAMTGHQSHPASGENFNGPTEAIPLRQVLEGLGVESIYEVDAYQQAKLTEMVKSALREPHFNVIIARHPCMLKFTREQRRKPGYQARQVTIDPQRCSRQMICIEQFACPTFSRDRQGRIHVNPDLCIGDGSCLQTCSSQAIQSPHLKASRGNQE
jgi:indolepyruvate ferredoxin oxidoreductase alpha subunit